MKYFFVGVLVSVGIRLVLFGIGFSSTLQDSYEVSTPISSWERMKEGFFLLENSQSPYSGSVFHDSPLSLLFFHFFWNISNFSENLMNALFIGLDLISAWFIFQIAKIYNTKLVPNDDKRGSILGANNNRGIPNLPYYVSLFYLLNPFIILSCIGKSTLSITHTTITISLYFTLLGNIVISTLFCCLSALLSVYPVVLIVAIPNIIKKVAPKKNPSYFKVFFLFTLFFSFLCLISSLSLSYYSTSSNNNNNYFSFSKIITSQSLTQLSQSLSQLISQLSSTSQLSTSLLYFRKFMGTIILVDELQPNIGIFWYFLTEMFADYRTFFSLVFQWHVLLYPIPVVYRLREHHPVFAYWVILGIISVFKSYPSVGDIGFYLSFIPLFYHKLFYFQYTFLIFITYSILTFLYPILFSLWIVRGTGNANFYYALNLVTAIVNIVVITDALDAVLKRDFMIKRKESQIKLKGLTG